MVDALATRENGSPYHYSVDVKAFCNSVEVGFHGPLSNGFFCRVAVGKLGQEETWMKNLMCSVM